ncbi:MAG: glycoside hydrolase family 99-like domain-containing protein [Terracidiphilus sp.]|nr:glycoside hydrolase family 99-like domain-containing protein [Terracidiphilus sp.]
MSTSKEGIIDRREFIAGAGAFALGGGLPAEVASSELAASSECFTAAYYFGNYHVDPRNEKAHGPRWTEWNLVRAATPRFPGHHQPKVPLWGYEDESDPLVFEKKISIAHANNLDALIFDWYWYEDGPFLNGALERGYLGATNNKDLKFALMWANHDWYDCHPVKLGSPPCLQFVGGVPRETFDKMSDRLLKLFQHPSYFKIDGAPYFSIYELHRFIEGVGGVREAVFALDALRSKARAIGLPGVHINAVTWGVQLLPGQTEINNLSGLLEQLKIDSTTSYVWVHHTGFAEAFTTEYSDIKRQYEAYRDKAANEFGRTYFPNVSVGWDPTPRTCQTDNYRLAQYQFTSVIVNNSPQAFEQALRSAKQFAIERLTAGRRLVTINSWNEWTEGSYLEPDKEHGTAYLEAIRRVFGKP